MLSSLSLNSCSICVVHLRATEGRGSEIAGEMAAAYHLVGDQKNTRASFLKLALFGAFADSSRSRRSFADGGAVGLGIVAAMSASEGEGGAVVSRPPDALSRSGPIHIGSWSWKPAAGKEDAMETDAELSESYTCVIAHLGGNKMRKKVYYGDNSVLVGDEEEEEEECFGTPPAPPELEAMALEKMIEPAFEVADFLRRCALCTKELDGLDIYMYKGEKGFCSEECRYRHIQLEELEEKLGSGNRKTGSAGALKTECSPSPSSASFLPEASMAAA